MLWRWDHWNQGRDTETQSPKFFKYCFLLLNIKHIKIYEWPHFSHLLFKWTHYIQFSASLYTSQSHFLHISPEVKLDFGLLFSYMFLVCVHISLCFHDLKWLSYSTYHQAILTRFWNVVNTQFVITAKYTHIPPFIHFLMGIGS